MFLPMPIFEYTCNTCATGRKFSALVGVVADAPPPVCPRCGGTDLKKLVSRFARLRSEDEAIDALAEQADRLDESDPKAVRRLVREMAGGMGDDMDADEFEQIMDEAPDDPGAEDDE
jgi:putative FmdB family regulatory protein